MPQLTIDNKPVEVPPGTTILQAARQLGIDIPTLCYHPDLPPNTSCMVCLVKINGRDKLLPSCAVIAQDGMQVESESEPVHHARRAALELLLSDHWGDCLAPCHCTCPAHLNIPLMLRQIAASDYHAALLTVKKHIALPAVLGRICPAPCEKACRRRDHDNPVAICLLKRFVADVDLAAPAPYLPPCDPGRPKTVAIIGAGPAGLSAAYYLLQKGCSVVIFDDHDQPGGMLRYGVSPQILPPAVLDAEINIIKKLDAQFHLRVTIGKDVPLDQLRRDYDAVLIATGPLHPAIDNLNTNPPNTLTKPHTPAAITSLTPPVLNQPLPLPLSKFGIKADGTTLQTELPGIFAAGDCLRPRRLAVRACAEGKVAASSIIHYLFGLTPDDSDHPFTVHLGKLDQSELEYFLFDANPADGFKPDSPSLYELTPDHARQQARRCLHCDCRKTLSCPLRFYARQYHAQPSRYKSNRRPVQLLTRHPEIIFEPGKCISCGICLQITARAREPLGLAFLGRGFDMRLAVPFRHTLDQGLTTTASQTVRACPTAALAFKNQSE